MKKVDDTNKQILNLGSLHEEIQKEKERNKVRKFPVILVLFGAIFILLGVFFPKIEEVLDLQKEKSKTVSNSTSKEIELVCTTLKKDQAIGITTKVSNSYTFKSDLLKKLKVVTTYTVMDNNFDAGSSNLSLYNEKYMELEKSFALLEGVTLTYQFEDNVLISTVNFDLEKVDSTKIPQNNFIVLSNTLNQEKRNIKEIEGKAGHICN